MMAGEYCTELLQLHVLKESPASGYWRFLEMDLATYLYKHLITSKQQSSQFPITH